jgi:hypothetical protein
MGNNSCKPFLIGYRENPARSGNQDSRAEAITGFLEAARQALAPDNVGAIERESAAPPGLRLLTTRGYLISIWWWLAQIGFRIK